MVNETNNNELDEAISAAIPQSQKRFDELVAKYAGKVIIVLSEWRAEDEHVKEVNKVAAMQKWGGVYHFPAWYEFSTASGDGIATLFSEKPIPYNVAEELVDLWYNQGAESGVGWYGQGAESEEDFEEDSEEDIKNEGGIIECQ